MPISKLTHDLLDNLEKPTIEDNLLDRLQKSLDDVTTATSFNPNLQYSRKVSSYEDVMKAVGGAPDQAPERSMLEGIGRSLWMAGAHGAEMATFGVGKLVGIKAPEPETTGEKVGAAIGGAAGFLIPFRVGATVSGKVAQMMAKEKSASSVAQTMQGGIRKILKDKGVDYKGPVPLKESEYVEGFIKAVADDVIVKPIKGFDKAIKTATGRQKFSDQMRDQAGQILDDVGVSRGFRLGEGAADDITAFVAKEWQKAGGAPISSIQQLLARKLGDTKSANFYSHLFEEGLIFAGVENVIHGINIAAGEQEADFLGTTAHAFALGHLLGAVRFVPGGVRGGTIGLFNKPGRERFGALVSKSRTWASTAKTNTPEGQTALRAQYGVFAKLKETGLSGGPIAARLKDRAMESKWAEKLKTSNFDFSNLDKISRTGSAEEKKAVAEIMRDGLGYISSQIQREWRGDFIRLWAEDIAKSTPRMLLGGLAMGNAALFSEDIPFEDKLITFATGAFLMKHGKEINYRGSDGSYQMRESLMAFPEKLKNTKELFDTLGADITDPLWFKMIGKVEDQSRISNLGMGIADQNPESIQDIINISNYQHPKSDRPMFTKKNDAPYKESKKKGEKPTSDYERIYRDFVEMNSKENILPEGQKFKEWSELHPKEKMKFKELLDRADIWDTMDVYDMYVEANTARFTKLRVDGVTTLSEAANELKTGEMNYASPIEVQKSNGTVAYKFKRISAAGANLTDAQKHAVHEYNALVELMARTSVHEIDGNKPVVIRRGDKGIDLFTNRIERGIQELNETLGFEGMERGVEFSDGWLNDGLRLLDLRTSINAAAKKIPKWFESPSSREGELLRKIFYNKEGLEITDEILVDNKKAYRFANALLPVVRLLDISRDSRVTGVSKQKQQVSSKDVNELMDLFHAEGITEFNVKSGRGRAMFSKQVKHHLLRQVLKEARLDDGKGGVRSLDATDIAIVQRFIDWGLQNDALTLKPIQNIMFDIESKGVFEIIERDGIEGLKRQLENDGITDPVYISNMKTIYEWIKSSVGDKNITSIGNQMIKDLNSVIRPFLRREIEIEVDGVKTKKTVGFLRESRDQQVSVTLNKLAAMVTELEAIKTGELPHKARKMLDEMDAELLSSESETKQMLMVLMRELAYNGGDPLKVYTLAVEHGLWNDSAGKFERLPEARIETILNSVIKSSKRNWGIETKSIDEMMEHLGEMDMNQSSSGFRSQTISQVIKDYKLTGDFEYKSEKGTSQSQQIQDIFYSEKYGNGTKYAKFLKDLHENIAVNNPEANPTEVGARLIKTVVDANSSRRIRVIKFVQGKASNSTWSDGVVKESAVMKLVSEAIGEKIAGTDNGNLVIIESSGKGRGGKVENLDNKSIHDSAVENLYNGKYSMAHETMGADIFSETRILMDGMQGKNNQPYIMYTFGNSDWSFGIENSKSTINVIGKNYFEYLKQKVKDGAIDKDTMDVLVKENKIELNEKGEYVDMDMPSNHQLAADKIHWIMNDLTMGKIKGNAWWTEGLREASDKEMSKIVKRSPLFNNVSANSLTSNMLRDFADYTEMTTGIRFDGKADVVKRLIDLADNKVNEVVVADELAGDQIADFFSFKNEQIRQYESARDKLKKGSNEWNELNAGIEKLNGIKDASDVNGVTYVEPGLFKALSYLFGATNSNEIGGIKPIILSFNGKGNFFVEKTAMVKNKNLERIFEANPDVGFVTFTSASKKVGSQYGDAAKIKNVGNINDLLSIESQYKRVIAPEDIKLISIKGDKGKATLPPNHTSHFRNPSAMKEFYNYHINREMDNAKIEMGSLRNPDNHHKIVATFRQELKRQLGDLDSEVNTQQSQLGVQEMWAEANGMPHIFKRDWENRLKRKYVDGLIRLKIDGGQGVMTPDIGIKVEQIPSETGRVTFETSKGSKYVVESDGTTTRDKAPRPEHPGDSGIKEKSSKTVYLSSSTVRNLFGPLGQLNTIKFDKATNKEIKGSETMQVGELGVFVHGKTYGMKKDPTKGYHPFEVWTNASGGIESYHVGNKITQIGKEVQYTQTFSKADKLKHTLLTESGDIWQVGEIEIGASNKIKDVDLKNIAFVKRNETSKDEIKFSDDKKIAKEIKGMRTLGELHEYAKKKGWQVAIATERNPHTKPDSILLLGLKGFRDASDGNQVVINAGDVKRALEGDYDIDTANFWWGSPKNVLREYISGRGTVTDSKSLSLGNSASYQGLSLNNREHMRIYRERRRNSDMQKGTVMNAQRIVQWLSHYQSANYSNIKGPVIKVGRDRYLTLGTGEQLKRNAELIAELNQHALDADNGYNMEILKNYDTVMDAILFGEGKHAEGRGLFKVIKFTDNKPVELTGTERAIHPSERQIVRNLVHPYRDLMSLANKVYDKGEGKKVSFQKLIEGIREFDDAMADMEFNAFQGMDRGERRALKKMINVDRATVYNGFNQSARFFDSKKVSSLRDELNLLPYDRVLANLAHIGDMSLEFTKYRFDDSKAFADEIKLLSETTDFGKAYREFSKKFPDGVQKSRVANRMEQKIENLYDLRKSYSNPTTIKNLSRRIKKLEKAKERLLKDISVELYKDPRHKKLRERIINRWQRKVVREYKRNNVEISSKDARKEAERRFEENGIPVRTVKDSDVVGAMAVNEAFGNFAYRNEVELGFEKSQYRDLMKDISDLKRNFAKAWDDFKKKDTGQWVNENHIYTHFLQQLDGIFMVNGQGNPQLRNVMIARLMSPDVSLAEFGSFRGRLFPMPKYAGMDKFINLGLRYNRTRNSKAAAENISKQLSDAYSKSLLRLYGHDTSVYDIDANYKRKHQIEDSFYLDPFEYSKGHSRDMFLGAVAGNAKVIYGKRYARLDEYEKLHLAFGSGLVRDIITNTNMLALPHDAVTAMSKYGYHYGLDGYMGGLQKAIDLEAGLFISTKGKKSVIGEMVNEPYEQMMNFNKGGRDAETPLQFVQGQNKRAKELCVN